MSEVYISHFFKVATNETST